MSETNSGQNQDKMDKNETNETKTETNEDKKFQCPYCGRFYKNKVSLEKHIKRFHKDVAENNDIEIEIEKPEPVKKKSEEKKEDKKDNKMIYIAIGIAGLVL
ncbi:MAG: C2H2-type zinc finger protein, partial [Fervidicoccaceae archaeon]